MEMKYNEEHRLQIQNGNAKLNAYQTKENVILYSEAYENVDMEYRLGSTSVETNYYINGPTNQKEITFSIEQNGLQIKENTEALLFIDEKEEVIFAYEEKEGKVQVTITLDTTWINDEKRIYLLTYNTRAAYQPIRADVTTSYVRSKEPTVSSKYFDLFRV